jgi:basic amino acid/polyamine antiporter, APA family
LLFAQPASAILAPIQELSGPVGIAGIAVAMRAIFNTYAGWEDVVYFGEDMTKPERTLVRSMFAGIVGVAIIYLLVNAALLHVLEPAQMARSEFPAADAARVVLGPSGDLALTIFGLVSVAAITNLTLMKSSRISFALARSGHLPIKLSEVSATGTPRPALTVGVLLGAAFAATGSYDTVVAASVTISLVLIIAVNFTVIRLRRIHPEMDRPFRVPLYPLPVLLAIILHVALLAVVIFEDPIHSLQGIGILAVLAVVYFAIHRIAERVTKPAI